MSKLVTSGLIGASLISPMSADATNAITSSEMIIAAQQMLVEYFSNSHDSSIPQTLLSEDVEVSLTVNGTTYERNKTEYLERLNAVFSDPKNDFKMTQVSYDVVGPNTLNIKDTSIQRRNGLGLEESGEQIYLVNDEATYTFKKENGNVQITKMVHVYNKIPMMAG